MPEEREFEFEEERIPEEQIETKTGRKVKIDWFENNIWNGKTGYVTWEDPEDSSELGIVTVNITDFPTEDGFQEVEQNFERRHVVDYTEDEELPEVRKEPVEEVSEREEEIFDDDSIPFEEEPREEKEPEVEENLEESKEEPKADEEEHECCICHGKFRGFGNNPWPVCIDGLCCDDCNWTKVIPARIAAAHGVPSDIDFEDEEFEDCENCREHTSIPDDE